MATVTIPPAEEARDVFKRLGYAIEERGSEFVAERKWRRVQVTPLCADDAKAPDEIVAYGDGGGPRLRCFVTWMDATEELQSYLQSAKPPYDWAIIGIESDGEFQVVHPEPGSAPI
ncbi:hypothetical protein HKK80_04035 [Halonotius sp. F2-221B]|jgi:hypothetical protein|uniref:DUF7116 family protein n=1 Tax=Halonotius sp. F2-221B TaxID=2731620 RepID=UPI00398BB306